MWAVSARSCGDGLLLKWRGKTMQSMKNMAVFAIAASAVFTLGAPQAAVAQSLVWTDPEPLQTSIATETLRNQSKGSTT